MPRYTRQQIEARVNRVVEELRLLDNTRRANAYLELADIYIDAGTHESLRAAHQLIIQAQITTYSGYWGASAVFGNYRAMSLAGTDLYNISLDEFSRLIDLRVASAVQLELERGGDGILSAAELHALDYSVWRELGMGHLFPGNLQRYFDSLEGFAGIPTNSIVFDAELYENPAFTFTRDMLADDLWTRQDATEAVRLGISITAWADDAGKLPSDYGIEWYFMPRFDANQMTVEYLISQGAGAVSADGLYRGFTLLAEVLDANGELHTINLEVVYEVSSGLVVLANDQNANIFELINDDSSFGSNLFGRGLITLNGAGRNFIDMIPGSRQMGRQWADLAKNILGADLQAGSIRFSGGAAVWTPELLDQECFLASTPVLMADGSYKPICEVAVGDLVKSFSPEGELVASPVTATHKNYADEVIELPGGVHATPGHRFLTAAGEFRAVGNIIDAGDCLVSVDGNPVTVSGVRLSVSAFSERSEEVHDCSERVCPGFAQRAGGLQFTTYNLTVGGTHTYIAGPYRVHNDSLAEFLPDGVEFSLPVVTDENGQQRLLGVFPDGRIVVLSGMDFDKDGNTDLALREYLLPDGSRSRTEMDKGLWQKADIIQYNQAIVPPWNFSGLMSSVGSSIGALLSDGDVAKKLVYSSVLGAVGVNLGQLINTGINNVTDHIDGVTRNVFSDFGADLSAAFQGASIGTVSSYLTLELGEALGLEGFGSELFQTASSTVFSTIFNNALSDTATSLFQGLSGSGVTYSVASEGGNVLVTADYRTYKLGALEKSIGAFLGAKLGSLVIQPETSAGAFLSSVGSTVGSLVFSGSLGGASAAFSAGLHASLSRSIGWAANFVLPGIGSFLGFVIGAFIGNLFGSSKPKIPTANAETILNFDTGYFKVGAVQSENGGNEDLVRNMSVIARDTINGLIEMVVYGSEVAGNANLVSPTQIYGHTDAQVWVKLGSSSATKTYFDTADEATDFGALWALRSTKVQGGDLYVKRAISRSTATSVLTLGGDVQIASDFAFYKSNEAFFENLFAAPYRSLAASDRVFYDDHQSLFHRVMMGASVALSASDQAWYDANQAQVDSIIDQLGVSQFAAGWIITLQRAAELGLNRTSRSDFYGGFGGFTDSLKILSGQDFDNEDVSFAFDGTTLNVDYGRWNGRAEDNLMRGGDLSLGADLLGNVHEYDSAGSYGIERVDGGSALVLRDTAFFESGGNHLYGFRSELHGGDRDDGRHFAVKAGEYVNFAFDGKQLGDSANEARLYVGIYDSAGTRLSWHALRGAQSDEWTTVDKQIQVDAGGVYARVYLYGYGRIGAGAMPSGMDIAIRNIQFNRSATAFAEAPAWSAPVYERFALDDFLVDGGFHAMDGVAATQPSFQATSALEVQWEQANDFNVLVDAGFALTATTGLDSTGGNDFYVHTASTGITLDDQRSETVVMTWATYYNQQGMLEFGVGGESGTFVTEGGDDVFIGGSGNDTLYGRSGYDWLNGGDGDDVIYGGSEDDVILGGGGMDRLYGEDGDDYIAVGSGRDYNLSGVAYGAWGGNGNDTLVASEGENTYLRGGNDDDLLIMAEGGIWSRFDGESGNDTMSFERFRQGVDIDFGAAAFYNGGTTWQILTFGAATQLYYRIENLTGSEFDDVLTGDDGGNVIRGLAGDDIIDGGGGTDTLEGGAGADTLDGGAGADYVSYEHSRSAVWVDMESSEYFGGDAEGDTLISINRGIGSDFADTFFDSGSMNTRFHGGRGDDWFVVTDGTANTDRFYGDEDFDTVDFADVQSAITVNLASNTASGGAAGRRFYDIEHVVGTEFADTITMDGKDNYIQGGKGNDTLNGGAGLDTYIYNLGDGDDTINEVEAGGGYDTLVLQGINWADLTITFPAHANGRNAAMLVSVSDGGSIRAVNNQYHWENPEAVIDGLDVGGVGAVDISRITWGVGGSDYNNTLTGRNDKLDILMGYAGNDVAYAAGSAGGYEQNGNLIWMGRGNDTSYASVGDDEYVFDRGDGADTIYDTGGYDRIQFGPDVLADDVIYEVVGNDLVIGLRDLDDPDLSASQVADRITVKNAGTTTGIANRVEYITAGGVDIDLNKLDIDWTVSGGSGGGGGGGGPGGGGPGGGGGGGPGGDLNLLPIAFDLDGDGLELVSVNESRVVYAAGDVSPLLRIGWLSGDDGFLALDRDGDGVINRRTEISFRGDFDGATTDLEGLRGFDSNADGIFDAADERWSEFTIWRDINQNGVGSASELMSLEDAGIVSINLTLTSTGRTTDEVLDSQVMNTAVTTMADGSTMSAYDVALRMILARADGSGSPGPDFWAGLDLTADGQFGVASTQAEFTADAIATLMSTWDVGDAGPEGAVWTDLFLHADLDDLLAAPDPVAADPGDPVTPTFGVKPIVIDMDGDGIELIDPAQSPVEIDADGDGALDRIGWTAGGDGMLALDRNGDGRIEAVSEISFVNDLEGATTDLEGLRAYDTNADGWLDASDDRYGDFRIWVDSDFSGTSEAGEITTLDAAGLERLSLVHIADTGSAPGLLFNTISGESEIVWREGFDGGRAGDVELRAYTGNLQEQLFDRLMQQYAQQRATGPWGFDRTSRREAMVSSRDAEQGVGGEAEAPGMFPLGPYRADGFRSNAAGHDDRFRANNGPFEKRSGLTMSNDPHDNGLMLADAPAVQHVAMPGLRQGRVDRWWLNAGEHHQQGFGPASLTERLAEFDQARGETRTESLPQTSGDDLAERQRFLQAMAAFRGSSGAAIVRRGDRVNEGAFGMFAQPHELSSRADATTRRHYG